MRFQHQLDHLGGELVRTPATKGLLPCLDGWVAHFREAVQQIATEHPLNVASLRRCLSETKATIQGLQPARDPYHHSDQMRSPAEWILEIAVESVQPAQAATTGEIRRIFNDVTKRYRDANPLPLSRRHARLHGEPVYHGLPKTLCLGMTGEGIIVVGASKDPQRQINATTTPFSLAVRYKPQPSKPATIADADDEL
ncbi:MAG: hypothetical protein M1826_002322 [Phylliscum demangeonii]|nr:MAG: hypothetical protein M1826_002322 [Phylliscum demangeonii]